MSNSATEACCEIHELHAEKWYGKLGEIFGKIWSIGKSGWRILGTLFWSKWIILKLFRIHFIFKFYFKNFALDFMIRQKVSAIFEVITNTKEQEQYKKNK